MKANVRVIGEGTEKSPYRVALPTYQMLSEPDHDTKTVVVNIPDDTLPEFSPDHQLEGVVHADHGNVVHKGNDHYLELVKEHFDQNYREHEGKFALELVPFDA